MGGVDISPTSAIWYLSANILNRLVWSVATAVTVELQSKNTVPSPQLSVEFSYVNTGTVAIHVNNITFGNTAAYKYKAFCFDFCTCRGKLWP